MSEPEQPHPQKTTKFGQTLFSLRTTLLITFCIFALLFVAGARDPQTTTPTPPPSLGTPLSTLAAQPSTAAETENSAGEAETTNGLILGAILLLLIIIIGTLAVIRSKEN